MKVRVWFDKNISAVVKRLTGAQAKYGTALKRELVRIGSDATRVIKTKYRRGGTTATATAIRSGELWASYHSEAKYSPGTGTLDVGIMKAKTAKILLYGRVQEGFNAAGQRVSQFVIVPRRAPYLHFPVRNQKGGLAKNNVEGWVRTKRVILEPRPALVHVKKPIILRLRKAPLTAARNALAA